MDATPTEATVPITEAPIQAPTEAPKVEVVRKPRSALQVQALENARKRALELRAQKTAQKATEVPRTEAPPAAPPVEEPQEEEPQEESRVRQEGPKQPQAQEEACDRG
eukprot:4173199-Prymnesium_polylepis.2